MNTRFERHPAAAAFLCRFRGFHSSSDPPSAEAAALLYLSIHVYRLEAGDLLVCAEDLLQGAFARACELWVCETELDDLMHAWHLVRWQSPAWELYMCYRGCPMRTRHSALSLLAGSSVHEIFLASAEETARLSLGEED